MGQPPAAVSVEDVRGSVESFLGERVSGVMADLRCPVEPFSRIDDLLHP